VTVAILAMKENTNIGDINDGIRHEPWRSQWLTWAYLDANDRNKMGRMITSEMHTKIQIFGYVIGLIRRDCLKIKTLR